MEIFLAPYSGFCFGVKRAISIAEDLAKEKNGPIYTYGPIIHNPQTVLRLQQKGIIPIDSLDSVKPGRLIIRSHGVDPSIIRLAKKKKFKIIDATCPFVKRAHNIARTLAEENYEVIAIGEKEHPEMKAMIGYTNGKGKVISPDNSLNSIKLKKKIGVVAQTTLSMVQFQKVISLLIPKVDEMRVYNTICSATLMRQKHAIKLTKNVELMIVIGGKNSANTRRLYELIKPTGCEVYHIETKDELKKEYFRGKEKIGITAGASTPNWIIKEVIKTISAWDR